MYRRRCDQAMKEISTFHDGSFDGLCIAKHEIHLFLSEFWGERWTVVLHDVKNMMMNDLMQGSIVNEFRFIPPEKLEIRQMRDVLGTDDPKYQQNLLETAQREKLSVLEVHSSYGVYGTVLFREVEAMRGYVFPALAPE
jgi:hypothetical protein